MRPSATSMSSVSPFPTCAAEKTALPSVRTMAKPSPERILRLGFAIVRTDGKAVFSAAQVGKGDTLDIEVADGRIEGTVQYTETK